MTSKKSKIIKKIITIFFVFILCFGVITEIFLRTFFYEDLKTRHVPGIYVADSLLVYNYIPNKTDSIITPDVNHKFTINNHGFFGPDFSERKNDSIYRIILIDNCNGSGLHMNNNNNYCSQLNKYFKRYGFKVEILNCAKNGSDKDIQNLAFIENKIVGFHPNVILYGNISSFTKHKYVYDNYKDYVLKYDPADLLARKMCIERVDKIKKLNFLTALYNKSFIIRGICKLYVDNHSGWNEDNLFIRNNEFEILLYTFITKESKKFCTKYYYTWSETIKEIKKTQNLLNKINCQFVLLNYGFYPDGVRDALNKNHIAYIQLVLSDLNIPINSKREGHINEFGHTLVADRLFGLLLLNKIIPGKYMPN